MSHTQAPPRRQPFSSLSTQILSFVFAATFLTAMVVSWISIQSTYNLLRNRLDQNLPDQLVHTATAFRRRLRSAEAELRGALTVGSRADELKQALLSDSSAAPPVQRILEAFLAGSEHFDGVAVLGAGDVVLARAGQPGLIRNAKDSKSPPAEGFWTSALGDAGRLRVVLQVSLGPLGGAGTVLMAALREDPILALLYQEIRGVRGGVFLFDSHGHTLLGTRTDGSGTPLGPPTPKLAKMPPGTVHELIDSAGVRWLGCVHPLGNPLLSLAVEERFDVAFAPLLTAVTRIFWIDVVVILGFSALAYRIASRILRPIHALSQAALRISKGEVDCEIPDPKRADEIGLLTRTFNDMIRKLRRNQLEIETANARLTDQYAELLDANEVLAQLSITDGLTKLHNHRYFQDHLTREIKRADRSGEPLSMLLADLDNFKQLNDRFGHAVGDELLIRVSRIMSETVRESDLLARYGGEEFVVLAPNTPLEGAVALAEKMRMAICERPQLVGESSTPVTATVSIGVAQYVCDRKLFFGAADRALYLAKAEGKNCVVADSA